MGYYLLVNKVAACLRKCKAIIAILFLAGPVYAQTVSGVSVSPSGPYCEGDNITVSFTLSGGLTGLSIGTTFEIVNNSGATVFANITPATTPVYNTNGTYTINLTIPYGGSIAGGNRRIRVTNYYWIFVTLSSDALSSSFTISSGSVGGAVSAAQTICSGSVPAALTLSGHTGSVVKWQKSANSTFTGASDISSTSATLNGSSVGALTANTYIRAVVQNGSCPVAYSAPVLITVNTINPGVIQKGATNPGPGCSPLDPNITGNATSASGGSGTITYSWEQSTDGGTTWSTAVGAASGSGTQFNPDPFTTTTRFRRVATSTLSGVTCSAYSNELIYQVYPTVTLSTPTPNPPANTVCAGSAVTLNTIVSGGTSPFNYQWTLNGSNVGPNAATFNLSGVTFADSGTYFVTVTDANGCTATVQRTINVITSRGGTVSSSATVLCNGSNSGTLNLSGYTGSILKWQYSINGGGSWTDIANTTNNQSYTNLTVSTMYRAVVQNGTCTAANSAAATITVPAAIAFGSTTVTNSTCYNANNGKIVTSASGGTGAKSYSISPSSGTQSPAGTFNNLQPNSYTITATDANGCTKATTATVTEPALLTFTFSKADVTSCVSGNGSITVTASGGTASYQFSKDNGTTYQPGNAFTGLSSGTYNVKVKDANGCESSTIAVTVNPPSAFPSVSGATYTNVTCTGGSNGTLTFSGSGGTSPYSYSIDNGTNYISGTNPKNFTGLAAGSYQVKVKDANGCESAATTIVINTSFPKPAGTITGNNICEGQQATITFNATAGSAPFTLIVNGNSYSGINSGVPFNITSPSSTTTYILTSITDNNSCTNP